MHNNYDLFTQLVPGVGGAVAASLVHFSHVRDLLGEIVSCSWPRHVSVTVPLSTKVYRWVPVKLTVGVTLQCMY